MAKATNKVNCQGKPLTLVGKQLKPGDRLPKFELCDPDHKCVKSSAFDNKVRIIVTVPCLPTSVCNIMARKFDKQATKLGKDVAVITVSTDLPPAQETWSGDAKVKKSYILSDHKTCDFGKKTGLLIKEWRMLSRAVLVVDKKGVVQFVHKLKDISKEPDYAQVLKEAKSLLNVKQ